MVVSGHVRALDEAGHDEADDAADFGRRRGPLGVIDSWRHFAGLCSFWYPVLFCSLRFFIAIARVAVNEGGAGRGEEGCCYPCVWSDGLCLKKKG